MDLDPIIAARLKAFLGGLGQVQARKLADAVERDRLAGGSSLPHEQILDGIRPILQRLATPRPGLPSPLRLFCEPFEDLLLSSPDDDAIPGRVSRQTLKLVWSWLKDDLLPDSINELSTRLADHTLNVKSEARHAVSAVLHAAASVALKAALDDGQTEDIAPNQSPEARKNLIEEIRLIADTLEMASLAFKLQDVLEKPLPEFDTEMVVNARRVASPLIENQTHLLWTFLFLVRARLEKTWQILRLAHALDEALAETGKKDARVMDRLSQFMAAELEMTAAKLENDAAILNDPLAFRDGVTNFISNAENIGREIQAAVLDSHYAERLAAIRIRLGARLCDICDHAPAEISRLLPLQNYGLYANTTAGAELDHRPSQADIDRALTFADFLRPNFSVFSQLGIDAVHAGARHLTLRHIRLLQHALYLEMAGHNEVEGSPAAFFKGLCDRLIETLNTPSELEAAPPLARAV